MHCKIPLLCYRAQDLSYGKKPGCGCYHKSFETEIGSIKAKIKELESKKLNNLTESYKKALKDLNSKLKGLIETKKPFKMEFE